MEKYHSMGEMKRGKALRVGEEKNAIRSLEQEVCALTFQLESNKKIVENLTMIQEDRQLLRNTSRKGRGAQHKVK